MAKDDIIHFSFGSYDDLSKLKETEKILFKDGPMISIIAGICVKLPSCLLSVNVFCNNEEVVECLPSEDNNSDYLLETLFTSNNILDKIEDRIVTSKKPVSGSLWRKNDVYCVYRLVNNGYFLEKTYRVV